MTQRTADTNYQYIAAGFSVGDIVVPYGMPGYKDLAGRIVALWPGIGMADVQFPMGNRRYPVEDLQRISENGNPDPPRHDTVPGGASTVVKPGGPAPQQSHPEDAVEARAASRVGSAFVKQALYWAMRDRKYRPTRSENDGGKYCCPRCTDEIHLQRASYKREDGRNVKLLACPTCLFLIRESDLVLPEGA